MRPVIKSVLVVSLLVAWPLLYSQENDKGKEAPKKSFTSDRHVALGLACKDCHGDVEKKQPVSGKKCLECHTSFETVADATKDLTPNPHQNHLIESNDVSCTDCHHGHKANEVLCHSCHAELKFEKKAAAAGK